MEVVYERITADAFVVVRQVLVQAADGGVQAVGLAVWKVGPQETDVVRGSACLMLEAGGDRVPLSEDLVDVQYVGDEQSYDRESYKSLRKRQDPEKGVIRRYITVTEGAYGNPARVEHVGKVGSVPLVNEK